MFIAATAAMACPATLADSASAAIERRSGYLVACLVGRGTDFHNRCQERPLPHADDRLLRGYISGISLVLGVSPNLKYLGDTCDLKAYAEHTNLGDTVYVGSGLVDAEFSDSRWGDIALQGILAHECAHLVQFRSPITAGRSIELEADFIAGYYLGVRWRKESFDMRSFLDSIAGKDNFENQATGRSHGTVSQRIKCIQLGFQSGFLDEFKSLQEVFKRSQIAASVEANH
jgi:hypothetical protein